MSGSIARFRVHGELSELVRAGQPLERAVDGTSTVKHLVEELGIPHTEYGEVRVNGAPSHGGHRVQDGDVVDVYRAEPPAPPVSEPRFLLDVHLGTLARYLRLLGFDTAYDNRSGDDDLLAQGAAEVRTLLTRDRGLLRRRVITDARLVRGTDPLDQLIDLVGRLRLGGWIRPYTRCTSCNGVLVPARRADVAPLVQPGTLRDHEKFAACPACGKVYWKGAHHARVSGLIAAARAADTVPGGREADAGGNPVGWAGTVHRGRSIEVEDAMSDAAGRRDRDAAGRPRSARPRDELGRPLPRGVAGEPGVPELVLPPTESLEEAQRLLDAGRAFHAHEVLEGTWKAAAAEERELWRGLAQIAVGSTHAQRGNPVGAVRLLRRAADRVEGYAAEPPYGIDAAGLVAWARALAARIEHDGIAGIDAAGLVPRLLR